MRSLALAGVGAQQGFGYLGVGVSQMSLLFHLE